MNTLHFGDNLQVLRDHISDESVDLIYLDPPFNSNATYNLLFEESTGQTSGAQIEAFRDTWEWGESAADAYEDVMRAAGDAALVMKGLKSWLGQNAMMAYLAMMTARLLHLKRVLKPTGSLYLHCDPKASHYLKVILDAVFGHEGFRNEIVWARSRNPKGSQHGNRRYSPNTDSILYYAKDSGTHLDLDSIRRSLTDTEMAEKYNRSDELGSFMDGPILRSASMGPRPNLVYEYKGFTPGPAGWRVNETELKAIDRRGDLAWSKSGAPRRKWRPSEDRGMPVGSLWEDIPPINSQARERLGYPTQKPLTLLERIIKASSKEGDVVLDPFCGCGTTVEAAESLKRQWIGIDVTHYAVTLIEARMEATHPSAEYKIEGRPVDLAGARDLARRDKHQFQWWAAWRVGAQSYREEKRGADRGIDGNIFFKNGPYGDGRIIISVKGGEKVGVEMVRDLRGVIEREEAEMGVLVTLANPTKPMKKEALDAGTVRRSAHGRMPRLQIVTAADLLEGRLPALPPLPVPERHPIRAPRRRHRDQLELLLPFPGEKVAPDKAVVVDPRFVSVA